MTNARGTHVRTLSDWSDWVGRHAIVLYDALGWRLTAIGVVESVDDDVLVVREGRVRTEIARGRVLAVDAPSEG